MTATLLLALAGLALAACGGSSTSTPSTAANTTANASATTTASTTGSSSSPTTSSSASTPPSGAGGPAVGRFSALRECLKKDGVALPTRKPGQRPGAGGFAAPQLPAGVTRAQFEEALKKCGGFARGRFPGAGGRFNSPAAKQADAKFAACMRENGVNLPAANTSGSGAIFDTKGVNVKSAAFKTAFGKCRSDLAFGFRARPGGAGAPAAPPSAG